MSKPTQLNKNKLKCTDSLAMDNHHPLMDNPVMVNHLHPIMVSLLIIHHSNKDLPSSISIMMITTELLACSVEQIPIISLEEQLDVLLLHGDVACFISQVFFAAYHAALMDVRMFNLFVSSARMLRIQFQRIVVDPS